MGNKNIKSIPIENISPNTYQTEFIDKNDVPSTENQNFKLIKKHNKDLDDKKLIEESLKKHFYFYILEKQAIHEIIKEVNLISIEANKEIFKQGSSGNYFYIIKEGEIELYVNRIKKKFLQRGDIFGEHSLLYGCPRYCTCKTISNCYLWSMEKKYFKKIIEHITHIKFEEIKKFVLSIPIFNLADHETKNSLCHCLYKEKFENGEKIYCKGEISPCIYLIVSGEVEVRDPSDNYDLIFTLKKNEYFGELELLTNSLRQDDLIAKGKVFCYSLSASAMYDIFGEKYKYILYLNFIKNSLIKSRYFKKFNVKMIEKIFQFFRVRYIPKIITVYNEGFIISSKMIIIINGELINRKNNDLISNRGYLLFEDDLLNNSQKRLDFNIACSNNTLLLEGDMIDILNYFGCSFKEQLEKSLVIESLKKVNLFKTFTMDKIEILSQKIKIKKIPNGKNLITQGEEGSRFYIIKSGKVDIFVKKNYIRTMNENEYLGERALFFKEPRSATATAKGEVEVFFLEKEDFIQVIEQNLKEYLLSRLYLQDNTVQLNDLIFYDILGSGNYGQVYLVKSKKNNYYYAIKNISNRQILYNQLSDNLNLERTILLQIDHPFIVKLVKTLKDQKFVYFLMDYIKGKDLFDVIRDIGLLSKFQTQFYGASMMLAVEYLHERKFIFRDIKPENIMVLENGYIKLIDFGTAKKINEKTNTITGTPHYMAPEVIMGEGYSFQVDFWSIACCMYEFMCGSLPFGESAEEPMEIYLSIINDKLTFPNFIKDRDFKNLMCLMLTKNYIYRYTKLSQISCHIWFQNFNCEELISMNMKPAFFPEINSRISKYKYQPFMEFVKTCHDWEIPEDQTPITEDQKKKFKDWLEHF